MAFEFANAFGVLTRPPSPTSPECNPHLSRLMATFSTASCGRLVNGDIIGLSEVGKYSSDSELEEDLSSTIKK